MFTTLLSLIIGITTILFIARWNHSSKAAWVGLTALLIGLAGGSICAKAAPVCNNSKHASLYQSVPMQGLTPQINLVALPQTIEENSNQASDAKPVGSAHLVSTTELAIDPRSERMFLTVNKDVKANAEIAMNLFDTS